MEEFRLGAHFLTFLPLFHVEKWYFFFQTSALSGKSVLRFIRDVSDKVTGMALRMEERDGW